MSTYETLSSHQALRSSRVGPPDSRSTDHILLRNDLEREFSVRHQELKSLYEIRVQTLGESIKNALKLVQNDELIETMRQDSASGEFV
jgi:hypothetical protein